MVFNTIVNFLLTIGGFNLAIFKFFHLKQWLAVLAWYL